MSANLLEVSLEGEGVVQLGGLYDPGVEDVGEEARHTGGQYHAEQGHVVNIYQHLSTHIYTYLHKSAHTYSYLHISKHIYTDFWHNLKPCNFILNAPRMYAWPVFVKLK